MNFKNRKTHNPLSIMIISLLTVLCAWASYYYLKSEKKRLFHDHFEADVEHRLWAFQQELFPVTAELKVAEFYFLSSDFVRRDEFAAYSRRILREHLNMELLLWLPRLEGRERPAYEEAVRAEGNPDFGIREILSDGTVQASREKDVYYPVHYIEPFEANKEIVGLDFASVPALREGIQEAGRSPDVVIAQPGSFDASLGHGSDIFAMIAVRSRSRMISAAGAIPQNGIAGILVTSINISQIAKSSMSVSPGILMRIEDISNGQSPVLIYSETGSDQPGSQEAKGEAIPVSYQRLRVAGKIWQIRFSPSETYAAGYRSVAAAATFFTILIAGGFLCLYLKFHFEREQAIEKTVAQRTLDFTNLQKIQEANIHRLEDEISKRQRIEAELRASEHILEELIIRDPLTNLLNRRGFQQALRLEISRMQREDSPLFAILIDVDDFKFFNDRHSHAVGDGVLLQIADSLRKNIRATDYAARIGGDEFLVLLPLTRLAEGWSVAEKIRLSISTMTVSLASQALKVTVSIGLTEVSPDIISLDEILVRTHGALSESKRSGKNRVSVVSGNGADKKIDRQEGSLLLDDLQETKSYRVLKQGIHVIGQDKVVGCEFLTRSTIRSFEMPEDFFRICRENNWLTVADLCCLRQCMCAAGKADRSYWKHINIYPSTLLELDPQYILDLWAAQSSPPGVCLEISEELIIGDPSNIIPAVRKLQASGIHIGLDDVGFGRSCLESLVLLEPDVVKIDKRLIHGVTDDKHKIRNLERLLRLMTNLETTVIVEGIETEREKDLLASLNVSYGQGYFWDKPS